MAYPRVYNRQFNFEDYQADNPTLPLPGDEVDGEYNELKLSLDEMRAFSALIQRSDGALATGVVTTDSLSSDVLIGIDNPTLWTLGEDYVENNTVFHENIFYICLEDHTATNLNRPDVDDTTWTLLADFTDATFVLGVGDVTETILATDAVSTVKIQALAVTTAKLDNLAVTAGKLAADAVETAKILDANVTLAKMANLAQSTIIGRAASAGTGVPTALTATQATAILDAASDTLKGTIELAVQSEMETGTDATRAVTPGRQHFHPSAAKCWGYSVISAGAPQQPAAGASFNTTSITDTATGRITITIGTDFGTANYCVVAEAGAIATDAEFTYVLGSSRAAGSFEIRHTNNGGTLTDPFDWSWVAFGDHA